MLEDKYIEKINQYFEIVPLDCIPKFVVDLNTKKKIKSWYKLECDDHCGINNLFIGLDAMFPASKPHMYAPELKEHYSVFPHLESDYSICYASDENTLLKSENPDSIIISAILKTTTLIQQLEDLFFHNKELFFKEIYKELICYFPNTIVLSAINPYDQNIRSIFCTVDCHQHVIEFFNKKSVIQKNNFTTKTALFIPLQNNFIPIDFIKSGCTKNIFLQLIKNNPHFKVKNKKLNTINYFLLSFELNPNNTVLLSAHIDNNLVTFSAVSRGDPDYYLKRSGAKSKKKHVLIVGCGSIGSHIATYLAKSGINHITLCDYDTFSSENISRHVLGIESIGKDKVTELQAYLQKNNIQITIDDFRNFNTSVRGWKRCNHLHRNKSSITNLVNGISDKKHLDVIILATGDQTFERNFHYMKKQLKTPIISVWVEPLNIGGHVFVKYKPQQGCYNCIIEHTENYTFTSGYIPETLSGCSGYFTNYNISSSIRTAELCTRIVLDICNNKYNNNGANMIHSWKGNDEQANQYNLSINKAYKDNSYEKLEQGRVLEGCTRCQE